MQEQCDRLEELFQGRTEIMHYYREKVDSFEEEADLIKECKQKNNAVTVLWRDKIYNEQSRAGRILEMAMSHPH